MSAPVNVYLQLPTTSVDGWETQSSQWIQLNKDVGGNPDFYPLTIKAFYIIGIMLGACRSVSILLRDPMTIGSTYYPAYAVFSSAIDLLGRCIRGNVGTLGASDDLRTGLKWLAAPALNDYINIPDTQILFETPITRYSIDDLIRLRHFTAHGQSTVRQDIPPFDFFVLERIFPKLPPAMESYWALLRQNELMCNRLAQANIRPYRNHPVFDSLFSFSADEDGNYLSIGEVFSKFDWSYKSPMTHFSNAA
jgi:hypothetical protein